MTLRASSIAFLTVPVVSLLVVACSGSDGASIFPAPAAADAGPTPSYDAGTFSAPATPSGDAGGSGTCSPEPLPGDFQPAWHPPTATHGSACTAQQTSAYYDACLAPPLDAQTCATFTAANGSCATCLSSKETDPTYGPVIWHADGAFFTLNIPGCLAIVEGNASATSCGAAYQAVLECKESVCTQCFGSTSASFSQFETCEGNASSECSAFSKTMTTTCDPNMHDASDPNAVCVPPSSTPIRTVYNTFAPLFCGP